MQNADFSRLIRSEEIVKAIRPAVYKQTRAKPHRNPLKKNRLMRKLNPYSSGKKYGVLKEEEKKIDIYINIKVWKFENLATKGGN